MDQKQCNILNHHEKSLGLSKNAQSQTFKINTTSTTKEMKNQTDHYAQYQKKMLQFSISIFSNYTTGHFPNTIFFKVITYPRGRNKPFSLPAIF